MKELFSKSTPEVILNAPELEKVSQSKAEQIQGVFEPMVLMLKELETEYLSIVSEAEEGITPELAQRSGKLSSKMRKIRTTAETARVREKAEYLRAGKAIDGVNNILKWAIVDKEKRLKEIENDEAIREAARLEELQSAREEVLFKYYTPDTFLRLNLMDEDVWQAFLEVKKRVFLEIQAAEKQAELDKLVKEETERQARVEMLAENKRVQEEMSKMKEAEAEAAAEIARAEEVARVELAARVALEREIAEKEALAKAELEKALSSSDADKKEVLKTKLSALRTGYEFKSAKNKAQFSRVSVLLIECEAILQ